MEGHIFHLISTICGNLNLPPLVQPRDLTMTEKDGNIIIQEKLEALDSHLGSPLHFITHRLKDDFT